MNKTLIILLIIALGIIILSGFDNSLIEYEQREVELWQQRGVDLN
jgi:hypothetical protein